MTTEEAALNKLLLEKVQALHVDDQYHEFEEERKRLVREANPALTNNIY